jgi:small subunit ribosomal protein S6e
MGSDVDGAIIGEEFKGYTLRITGGNDKQGFSMKQGIMVNGRIRILMRARTMSYRPRRSGERKRKSVRGCICGPDLCVIALKVLEKGDNDVPNLTDAERPRRLGPKRIGKIRKAFQLRKKDDVTKYVVRREMKSGEKTYYKSPKIQRLITEKRFRRKALNKKGKMDAWKASREASQAYEKLLSKFLKEKKAAYKAAHKTEEAPKKVEAPAPVKKAPAKPAAPVKAAPAKPATKAPARQTTTKPAAKTTKK